MVYENNSDEELNEKIIIRKKEKEESRKFVDDNIDDIKTKFDSIIEEKIDKDYLVDLELNKPEKQTERIENIKKLSEEIFQEKTKEQFLEELIPYLPDNIFNNLNKI